VVGDGHRRQGEHPVGEEDAGGRAGHLRNHIRTDLAPAQTPEHGVDDADHRVEVGAGQRSEGQDDRHQRGAGDEAVLEELEPGVVRAQALSGDPGADHGDEQERRADELADRSAQERHA
jgi:hypothetical protein